MSSVAPVEPVKLFVVTIHRDLTVLEESIRIFEEKWGGTDYCSEDFPFDLTGYYEQEMGPHLMRRFYSFRSLISPDQIVEVKHQCMEIEAKFSIDSRRRINLDPGYLDTYKLILASAKFGGQKIYLRDGVYADMTMVVYKGKWNSFLWGFPDFKSGKYDRTLFHIRDLYKNQRRSLLRDEQPFL